VTEVRKWTTTQCAANAMLKNGENRLPQRRESYPFAPWNRHGLSARTFAPCIFAFYTFPLNTYNDVQICHKNNNLSTAERLNTWTGSCSTISVQYSTTKKLQTLR